MQQFTVPQFIDVEDKVIGPVTVRQFIIMMVGLTAGVLFYNIFDFTAFLVMVVADIFVIIVVAFAKINGVHFHLFLLNFIFTLFKPKIRVWNNAFGKKELRIENEKVVPDVPTELPTLKTINTSRLSELSLIVDTQGVYRGEGKSRKSLSYTKEVHSRGQ